MVTLTRPALADRIVAADPGLVRLYMAARASASVGTALGLLLLLRSHYHFGLSAALVGVPLGMVGILTVNDTARQAQRTTNLLLCVPALASVTMATFAAGNRFLSEAFFVVVLFFATYARQYGARASSLGVIFFVAAFFALVFQIRPADLPWAFVSIVTTILCTYVYRFVVFRDAPKLALRNAAAAFRARQRLIEADIQNAVRLSRWTRPLRTKVNWDLSRLNETALMLDDVLRCDDDRVCVLDAELASAERADRSRSLSAPLPPMQPLQLSERAPVNNQWTPRGPFRTGTQIETGRIPQALRQAIQLTAAGIVAMVLGEIISADRWYWAVLTAFFVFVGTSSSAETRLRAWARALGTAIGVVAGILISYPMFGHNDAAFAALIVSLFLTVYTVRLSYAAFTFFITIDIAILYIILGLFSDRLLILRLIETALGALLGGSAAVLLLPISGKHVLFNVTMEALRRLDAAVACSLNRLAGDTTADPIEATRKFDEALQSARVQLDPLVSPVHGAANPTYRTRMALMNACGYYLHQLVALAYERPSECPIEPLRAQGAAISADISALINFNGTSPAPQMRALPGEDRDNGRASSYLHGLDRALHGVARTLG